MRFRLGDLSEAAQSLPQEEGWHRVRGPGSRLGYVLAGVIGLALLCGLIGGLSAVSLLALHGANVEPGQSHTPWAVVVLILLLYIPAHELLHALWHPRFGFTPRTIVAVWPARLRFGVYYEGRMSRTRWLLMRATPFAALCLLPAGLLGWSTIGNGGLGPQVETCLQVLLLVNAIGSGGDILAMVLVWFQIPHAAQLCFHGGRAYWRPESAIDVNAAP
jgi:hypothetical protein